MPAITGVETIRVALPTRRVHKWTGLTEPIGRSLLVRLTDDAGHVLGIFTDGDLRRQIERGRDLRDLKARDVMTRHPRTVRDDALAVEAADLMEDARITSVLVVDAQGQLVGALNSNDLMRAKVI